MALHIYNSAHLVRVPHRQGVYRTSARKRKDGKELYVAGHQAVLHVPFLAGNV